MGSTLTNTQPKDTYKGILKTSDTTELSATAKYVSDGNGNDSVLALSTSKVGVGTTSPNAPIQINGAPLEASPARATIRTFDTSSPAANVGAGMMLGYQYDTAQYVDGACIQAVKENGTLGNYATSLAFLNRANGVGLTEKVRILSSGGITFNGDTAAANALSDYEIGTCTVSLNPGTSGTINLHSAYTTWTYTKIGRQVTINGVAVISSVSSPVGSYVRISGLPFTIQNYSGAYGAVTCMFVDDSPFDRSPVGAWHSINETYIYLAIDAATIAGNDEFYVTATYFV